MVVIKRPHSSYLAGVRELTLLSWPKSSLGNGIPPFNPTGHDTVCAGASEPGWPQLGGLGRKIKGEGIQHITLLLAH